MAYNDFTLRILKEQFGITAADAADLFGEVPPLPARRLLPHTAQAASTDRERLGIGKNTL